MKKKDLFLGITKNVSGAIKSFEYLCNVRISESFFTRKGKLGLENMILFMLNLVKKTLQIELDNFFQNIGSKDSVRKQAFSEGRQKISHEAFTILIEEQIRMTYTATDLKTYKGYRVTAVDSSTTELENTVELKEVFGFVENATVRLARAKVSGLFDVGKRHNDRCFD